MPETEPHVHAAIPCRVKNIMERCVCGWWRWHPELTPMLRAMEHKLDWQPPKKE